MLEGKAANMAFSMLRPFWIITMMVWPDVTAGAMSDSRVGGMSGQFFVTVTM